MRATWGIQLQFYFPSMEIWNLHTKNLIPIVFPFFDAPFKHFKFGPTLYFISVWKLKNVTTAGRKSKIRNIDNKKKFKVTDGKVLRGKKLSSKSVIGQL